jgi:NDP-sugar pyrophosphorylase family protein
MSGAFSAAPFSGAKDAVIAEGAKIEDGAVVQGPCFIDEGTVVRTGARVEPYSVIGKECHIEEAAVVRSSIVWSGSWIGRDALVDRAIVGRNVHVGRNARVAPGTILGDKSVLTDFTMA